MCEKAFLGKFKIDFLKAFVFYVFDAFNLHFALNSYFL